ncbi:MAG: serine hydrolase [Planctomyces sp.]|nr:serine hydrolase [Planctomyces sp.]
MSQTSFRPGPEQVSRIAKLYEPSKSGNGLQPGHHWLLDVNKDTTPNPSGGLYSTAGDLAILYQMFLNEGEMNGKRILSKDAVEQMTTVQTRELKTGFTEGNGWGLGFCVVREPNGPTISLSPGSFGHGGAFGTQGWIDPQQQSFYILLICRQNFGNGDASELRTELQRLGRTLQK